MTGQKRRSVSAETAQLCASEQMKLESFDSLVRGLEPNEPHVHNGSMKKRPCFLVVDREFAGSISTRKLLIETAKFNVITAYSGSEALETAERFPAVNGIVLDASLGDMECDELIEQLKVIAPGVPTISIEGGTKTCTSADYNVPSFDPATLLEVLRGLQPKESDAIDKRDEELNLEAEAEAD